MTSGRPAIALLGMSCRYPGAADPSELWEAVLAGRRAFRRIPAERLRAEDYAGDGADSSYLREVAVIDGWELDRAAYRVAGSSFRAADPAHWLALDTAARALADAGFPGGEGLPREDTGVIVGNSLTGEVSRAQGLRLRWPYVERTLKAALAGEGWPGERRDRFLARFESLFKEPFPEPGEETLAGGLANTIAGRIANHFDLGGGGFTVDGACSSSLLAVTQAASSLVAGELAVAVVGGVDLSLDPFELVGFSRTGAFARGPMRIFDRRPTGFLPGEGAGFAVLMPLDEALRQGRRVRAVLRGWGMSSDGSGGLTRPEPVGQARALARAYRGAGFGPDSVAYFEAHGTGTAVGDPAELATLDRARREAGATGRLPAAVGSIKALIGHTKAAAGIAGLIKVVLAVEARVIPATIGCEEPHLLLAGGEEGPPVLRVMPRAEPWPNGEPVRAGVSSFGFGGINAHVVVEAAGRPAVPGRHHLTIRERFLDASRQDAELLVAAEAGSAELAARLTALADRAEGLSHAEVGDLAAALAGEVSGGPWRAAVVADSPAQAAERLRALAGRVAAGDERIVDPVAGFFAAAPSQRPANRPLRIGLLFPGQGSPARREGGAWSRRFEEVDEIYQRLALPAGATTSTDVAQPALALAAVAGLAVLRRFGLEASVAVGHSVGELAALHAAGWIEEEALLLLATARGAAMAAQTGDSGSESRGGMVALDADESLVADLLTGSPLVVAADNAPSQVVVAGPVDALEDVIGRAIARGIGATRLRVAAAFHSPAMAGAGGPVARQLEEIRWSPPLRRPLVVSTVTGEALGPEADPRSLLLRQLTAPVRFREALARAADAGVELWFEVGPGQVLSELARRNRSAPAVALDVGGGLAGLLAAAGAGWILGAPLDPRALYVDRFTRPLPSRHQFLANPCESAPLPATRRQPAAKGQGAGENAHEEHLAGARAAGRPADGLAAVVEPGGPAGWEQSEASPAPGEGTDEADALSIVRSLVAQRSELPLASVEEGLRLLSDLHLNSITVGQIVIDAARRIGTAPPPSPTDYADATVSEVAEALSALAARPARERDDRQPAGVDTWVRCFERVLIERERPAAEPSERPFEVLFLKGDGLGAALAEALGRDDPHLSGQALMVCVASEPTPPTLDLMLRAACSAMSDRSRRLVLVHRGIGAAFARTLHLERAGGEVLVIEVPEAADSQIPAVAAAVAAEASARIPAGGYAEVVLDAGGRRRQPVLRLMPHPSDHRAGEDERAPASGAEPPDLRLGPQDVLLVTGGGRGIAAEAAFSLARTTGAALALIGRSSPEGNSELAGNLERFTAAGLRVRYVSADVTDPVAVTRAIAEIQAAQGPVTAVLHGAGVNRPRPITALSGEDLAATLAVKVGGLGHVLAAVDMSRLRLLVAFGSVIAVAGLPGEADYALANEALAVAVERVAAAHPSCRCRTLEWSVWSGVGMGERLGTLDALLARGITPISPDRGLALLAEVLARKGGPSRVVITGRLGDPPTIDFDRRELPFLRFLERERVHVPGVELVVDCELTSASDPYLEDHVFAGERLFPAVLGLEAIAQVAAAVLGKHGERAVPVFEDVRFLRPVAALSDGSLVVRLAALVSGSGKVEVVLRTSATSFQVDHFRAVCCFPPVRPTAPAMVGERTGAGEPSRTAIDPATELYGAILFQRGRFRRLASYRRLAATECLAEIAADGHRPWFGLYLPVDLLLGDPAARDAAIHAIQACIPHATVLPAGVERLVAGVLDAGTAHWVVARERSRAGRDLVYDVEVLDAADRVVERWEGLALRAVEQRPVAGQWPAALLAPYLERRLGDLLPDAGLRVALEREAHGGAQGRRGGAKVMPGAAARRRPDGRPDDDGGRGLSRSHGGGLLLTVVALGTAGCDIEPVTPRALTDWRDLLGEERCDLAILVAAETGEVLDSAATRVWSVGETVKKAGLPVDAPLTFESAGADGWVKVRSGETVVASLVVASEAGGEGEPKLLSFAFVAVAEGPAPGALGHRALSRPQPVATDAPLRAG